MRNTRRIGWVLATAVAAVSFVGSSASAQQRVGGDGRALDANNRVGSGGINEGGGGGPLGPGQIGNQIVTGNVTAGQQFRGFVPYSDPFSFRAPVGGTGVDRFVRDSAGVPIRGGGVVGLNNNASALNVRPFYGESTTATRPPGFVDVPGAQGFLPVSRLSRDAGDLRLGRPFDVPQPTTPQPGQLILPGPLNPDTQQPTVITASPLYGVRQWNFSEQLDQEFLQGLSQPASQRARLDERTLQRLRDELNRDARPDPNLTNDGTNGAGDANDPNRLNSGIDSRLSLTLSEPTRMQDRVDASVRNDLRQDIRPGDLSVNRPERQSAQYAEMQRRLNRFNQLPEQVAELREYQRQQQQGRTGDQQGRDATAGTDQPGDSTARRDATARPGTGAPGTGAGTMGAATPGAGAGTIGTGTGTVGAQAQQPRLPDVGVPDYAQRSRDIMEGKPAPTDPGTNQLPGITPPAGDQPVAGGPTREPPLQVQSLATGVNAKALADFLNEAEKLMREGKFYSALDQYDMADQVAPNDPMVNLGRAIAELGASYYARAEGHLREAFTKNPALLTAQYDLRGFLGEERLNFLVNDLRAISNKEAGEPRSVFLLAFIDYNTGNPRRAAAYLDLAERRAGKPDPLFQSMRKLWNLPAAEPAADGANK